MNSASLNRTANKCNWLEVTGEEFDLGIGNRNVTACPTLYY